jgi:DNA-binding IclR family transcriptional regulator
MIQVIERIGVILDLVAEQPEGASLKSIEDASGLNKGTLCNLLKSLCEIGYVSKKHNGVYILGDKLKKLAYPQFIKDTLFTIASKIASNLAEETRESGMVVVRCDDELQVIAKEIYDQSIVINARVFESLPGYSTAIGHIFMAFDPELDVKAIYENELSIHYSTLEELNARLEKVRKDHYFVKRLTDRHSYAIAVPVWNGDKLIATLAMLVPDIRFNTGRDDELIQTLIKYGSKMSRALSPL